MPWSLEFTPRSRKSLVALPPDVRRAVGRELSRLLDDPGAVDLRKLAGHQDEWRLRVGEYRVRLRMDKGSGTIHVKDVRPRGSAYRE